MDFGITPENRGLVERASACAREIPAPRADACAQGGRFPREARAGVVMSLNPEKSLLLTGRNHLRQSAASTLF